MLSRGVQCAPARGIALQKGGVMMNAERGCIEYTFLREGYQNGCHADMGP